MIYFFYSSMVSSVLYTVGLEEERGDVQGEFLGLFKCLGVDYRNSVKEAS